MFSSLYEPRYGMKSNNPDRSKEQVNRAFEREDTLPLAAAHSSSSTGVIDNIEDQDTALVTIVDLPEIEDRDTARVAAVEQPEIEDRDTARVAAVEQPEIELPTRPLAAAPPPLRPVAEPKTAISRGQALIGILFLAIVVFNAINAGNAGFIGSQGWAIVLNGSTNANATNPLDVVKNKLKQHSTPGVSPPATPALRSAQYINDIIQSMTLNQKLGQMMIVQFVGSTYLPDISA